MADIKTKDAVRSIINTTNKTAVAIKQVKHSYISTKEKAEQSAQVAENSADEYASNKAESGINTFVHKSVNQFNRLGQEGVKNTKENYKKYRTNILKKQVIHRKTKKGVKVLPKSPQPVKRSIKTAENAAKSAQKTVQGTIKVTQKAAQAAKVTAKATVATAKMAVKATVTTVKAAIAGTKALIAAIAAGGWVAVVVIIVICLIALLLSSVFGIFFSGEDLGKNGIHKHK